MNYQETLDYLYNSLPMFHRIGAAALKPSLNNTIELCSLLGNPQEKFKSIHVAGTNGKGSSSHMFAAVLQAAGYKTGLYTSPHLKSFTERIRINGMPIPEARVVEFVEKNKTHFERIQLSFFEMTVGMAFEYFAEEKVDIAIIEVGLGGRLDSTNIIHPILSLITNISFDHEGILGDTLPKIASEKAGIIKKEVPVVVSEYQPEISQVFADKAEEYSAPLTIASELFDVLHKEEIKGKFVADVKKGGKLLFENLTIDLPGNYQKYNLAGVLASFELLNQKGFRISNDAIFNGLANVVLSTGLKGRWQILKATPLVICDTGHNEAGIKFIAEQIKGIDYKTLHFVLGTVNDKNISKILSVLPKKATYYFAKPDLPRGLDAHVLQKEAFEFELKGDVYPSVNSAVQDALSKASPADLVFIGGSNFVVAEIDFL